MERVEKLQEKFVKWGEVRGLVKPENEEKQHLKLIEEIGELAKGIVENNKEMQRNAIGDCFCVMSNLYEIKGVKPRYFDPNRGDNIRGVVTTLGAISKGHSMSLDYLNDLAHYLGHDLLECAEEVYDEIVNRKGVTVNGAFIREK